MTTTTLALHDTTTIRRNNHINYHNLSSLHHHLLPSFKFANAILSPSRQL
jgi:hypothetical protein